jgi:hypothetical protein
MKKILLFIFLSWVSSFYQANASTYKVHSSGAFIVITQRDFSGNDSVSVRKSAVISTQLDGRKIILVVSVMEANEAFKSEKEGQNDRYKTYVFESDYDVEAKTLFDSILKELGADKK